MKKQITTGIGVIAFVTLCAAVWQRSAEVGDLPAKPVKTAASAEIEARSEETPHIYISADMLIPMTENVTESNSPKTEITAEKEKRAQTQTAQQTKSFATSSESHNGDVRVVDDEKQIYLLRFGWIKDEGGGSIGTIVGNPGDELTSNKVGIMGGDESTHETAAPPAEQPEITGDVIYAPIQPPVTRDSTPPPYKPNGEPINP